MGKGSTQVQHLVQTEVPVRLLDDWLALWTNNHGVAGRLRAELRPHAAGSELLSLSVVDESGRAKAGIVFAPIQDRRGHKILSMRYQETFDSALRRQRLMTLMHLFLIHRYDIVSVHYLSPNEDNESQAARMKRMGIYDEVNSEIGHIIVASVNSARIAELLNPDRIELLRLIGERARPLETAQSG